MKKQWGNNERKIHKKTDEEHSSVLILNQHSKTKPKNMSTIVNSVQLCTLCRQIVRVNYTDKGL